MKINDLRKLAKNRPDILKLLNNFEDRDIILHKGKWDYESGYAEECCSGCGVCENDCFCDEVGELFSGCVIKYIDDDGEEIYDTFGFEYDNFQGVNLDNYNLFFDEIMNEIHIFKNNLMCDGVVEGYFNFDSFTLVYGFMDRK